MWQVPEEKHQPGLVVHTIGYPASYDMYGGGFIYHMSDRRVALGYVIGLDYSNPHTNTFLVRIGCVSVRSGTQRNIFNREYKQGPGKESCRAV